MAKALVSKQEIPKPEQDPGCQEATMGKDAVWTSACDLIFSLGREVGRENGSKMHALSSGGAQGRGKLSVRVAAGSVPGECGTPLL